MKDEGKKTEDESNVTVVVDSDNESTYLIIIAIASVIIVFLTIAVIYFAFCKDRKGLSKMTKTKSETTADKPGKHKSAKSGDDQERQESTAPKQDKLTSILTQMRRESIDSRSAL